MSENGIGKIFVYRRLLVCLCLVSSLHILFNMLDKVRRESFPTRKAIALKKVSNYLERIRDESLGSRRWVRAGPYAESKFVVFSAYWDSRTQPYGCVKVIAICLKKKDPIAVCRFAVSGNEVMDIYGNSTIMREDHRRKYTPTIIHCCPGTFFVPPKYVFVFQEGYESHGALLSLINNGRLMRHRLGTIAACIKPFHDKFNDGTMLLEFLEFYRMMGVELFVFYNVSVGPDVELILKSYERMGLAQIIPWDILDIQSPLEIHTYGMFAALNDCLYRHMGTYQYLVNVDVDEYFVPKKHRNFGHFIKSTMEGFGPRDWRQCWSGFHVFNEFFYRFFENDTKAIRKFKKRMQLNGSRPYLLTQYKTRKLMEVFGYNNRSKYIAIAENVFEMSNHVVYRPLPGCKMYLVPLRVMASQHYRMCERNLSVCLSRKYSIDRTAHRFGVRLTRSVNQRCQTYANTSFRCSQVQE